MEGKLKDRIDLENLAVALERGEEFQKKGKRIGISFNGTDVVVTQTTSYIITEKFAEENEEKLIKLGILK